MGKNLFLKRGNSGQDFTSTTPGDSGATKIGMSAIGTPTFTTLQHMQNLFHSSGWVEGGVVSDNGDDTVAVTAGDGAIKATIGATSEILFFDWAANTSMSVPSGTTRYVGVEYNAGSPQLVIKTSDSFDDDTDFILASLINEGGTIHIQKEEHAVGDHSNNMINRLFDTLPFARDNRGGGLILGESGDNNRNLTMTAGAIWEKLNKFTITAIDTSVGGGDTFDRYLTDGAGGHTKQTGQTQWDNTQFDNAGTLTVMGMNKFAVQWFYIELDSEFVSIYGTAEYNTEAGAENEAPPTDIPDRVSLHGKLIGRLIFKKSATLPSAVESVFVQTFTAAGVTDHGNLAGLGDDDHTQYLLVGGSRELSADWDAGAHKITALTLESDVATGAAPLIVASTTVVPNLNVSFLGGKAIGTSGNTIPLLDANNTYSGLSIHTGRVVMKDNISIDLGTGASNTGDAAFYHDGADVILEMNGGPSKVFDHFVLKDADMVFENQVEGIKQTITVNNNTGANLNSSIKVYLMVGDVLMTDTKGITMIGSGSFVEISINYDITGTDGDNTLALVAVKNGSAVWINTISSTVADDKEETFTQARGTDVFSDGDTLSFYLQASGFGFGSIDVEKIIVAFKFYDNA